MLWPIFLQRALSSVVLPTSIFQKPFLHFAFQRQLEHMSQHNSSPFSCPFLSASACQQYRRSTRLWTWEGLLEGQLCWRLEKLYRLLIGLPSSLWSFLAQAFKESRIRILSKESVLCPEDTWISLVCLSTTCWTEPVVYILKAMLAGCVGCEEAGKVWQGRRHLTISRHRTKRI